MQGYIVRLQRVKDEDLIVAIITQNRLETVYRFYGSRHAAINLGFKIDFEIERSLKSSVGRLYDVVHLGFPWLLDPVRTRLWHQFVSLFYPHLKDSEETGAFYFCLLDACAALWGRQNPKRVALEAYAKLLEHEGRLPDPARCFFCEQPLGAPRVSLIRSLLCAHTACVHSAPVNMNGVRELFENKSTLFLDDKEVDTLWLTLLEGL